MRCYAYGTIHMSKKINDIFCCGYITGDKFEIEYEEYFVDEVEEDLDILCDLAKEVGATLSGSITMEADGEIGEYVFDDDHYEEFWGEEYHVRHISDENLKTELERRGYKVTKEEADD